MVIVYYLVITLHVIACLFLIGVVLLQQGKSQDLASAFGGGGTQTAFGPRGSANVLSRATTVLAALFMITSLSLSVMRPPSSRSILDEVPGAVASPSPGAASPAAGSTPVTTLATTPAAAAPAASVPASVPATTVAPAPASSPAAR